MIESHSDPLLGPAWNGLESYNQFANSVKSDLYVRSNIANDFLGEVLATCARRKLVIPKNRIYWRARLGCDSEEIANTGDDEITVVYDQDRPYGAQGMKPIPNWQGEGRANPRGIPCLYLATTRDTSLAEIRPWIGATISVAQLKVIRDLNIIDCSKHHSKGDFIRAFGDQTLSREDGMWIAIDQAFATPVGKDVESKEYIPTQILAELFKSLGYDGIVYKSLLSADGFNLALFNLSDADVVNCALFNAKSISFDFTDLGNQYFIGSTK